MLRASVGDIFCAAVLVLAVLYFAGHIGAWIGRVLAGPLSF